MKQMKIGDDLVNCFPTEPEGSHRREMAALLGFCNKMGIEPQAFWSCCGSNVAETKQGIVFDDPRQRQLWTTLPVEDKNSFKGAFQDGTPFSSYFGGHYVRFQNDFLAQEKEREKALLAEVRQNHVNPPPPAGRFEDLYVLGDLFQIPIHSYEVWGSCSVALVNIHPDWRPGTPGRFKHLIQFDSCFSADFAIGEMLGVPCTQRFDDYMISI